MTRRDWLRLLGAGLAAAWPMRAARAQQAAGMPSAEGAAEIKIDNFVFNPASVTIKRGATVRWVNHDDIPHSVLFPTLGLRSKVMDTDQSYEHRFEAAGSFDYMCGLHPHMKGKLIVTA